MKNWQKLVLTLVVVGIGTAAAWFYLGTEEPIPEIDMEPVEEEAQ